jgi:uncharacterized protein involved in outer membrane biogenesis
MDGVWRYSLLLEEGEPMKKLLIIVGVLIVIIIGFLVFGISNLGPIIKKGVNTYGSEITKTEVRLGDVDVALLSGRAGLKDLFLGNPKGFTSSKAISVDSVLVDVDEKSLAGDTIVIDKIEVVSPEITFEKVRGTDNFQAILRNVKDATGQSGSSKKTPATEQEKGPGKNLLIKDFLLTGGNVTLTESMLAGKTFTVALPEIHLTNVGNNGKGAPPAETIGEILAALYTHITSPAVTEALNQEIKKLGIDIQTDVQKMEEDAKKNLEDAGIDSKQLEGVTDQLKGLLGK